MNREKQGAEWCETICTKELTEKICEHIRVGNYVTTACQAEGISKQSYYRWLRKAGLSAKDGKTVDTCPYMYFAQQVEIAQAKGEVELLSHVHDGKKGWVGKAWILERTRQDRFGQKQQVSVKQEVRHVLDAPPSSGEDMELWLKRHRPVEALPPSQEQD